jgi:hypothetical protein
VPRIFESIHQRIWHGFSKIISEDLTIRGPSGESLLSAALAHDDMALANEIRDNPHFDFSKQEPALCIAAVARVGNLPALQFLLSLPGVDLNTRLPHGVNGFPDVHAPPTYQKRGRFGGTQRLHLHEGVRLICTVPLKEYDRQLLGVPTSDPNQGGKHGRHGNTATIQAVLSRNVLHVGDWMPTKCDLTLANENGDTALDLANSRARRGAAGITGNDYLIKRQTPPRQPWFSTGGKATRVFTKAK